MSLTSRARQLYPHSRRLAAKWVLARRLLRREGLTIKPHWGVKRELEGKA